MANRPERKPSRSRGEEKHATNATLWLLVAKLDRDPMGKIIWLASYPKSGNTWLRAFLHNFLRDPDRPYDINKLTDVTAGESQASWYRSIPPDFDQDSTDERVRELRPLVHRAISQRSADTVLVK